MHDTVRQPGGSGSWGPRWETLYAAHDRRDVASAKRVECRVEYVDHLAWHGRVPESCISIEALPDQGLDIRVEREGLRWVGSARGRRAQRLGERR